MSDDDEEDVEEEKELQKGFIVDDDYLSVSELDLSQHSGQDDERINEEFERRKLLLKKQRESKEAKAENFNQGP